MAHLKTPPRKIDNYFPVSNVTAASEKGVHMIGFCSGPNQFLPKGWTNMHGPSYNKGVSELDISPRRRLDDVARYMGQQQMGGTDCALPMVYAQQQKLPVDTFVVYTDNETWAGDIHPHQALERYRQASGINAKLVVVGMTATEFSIADMNDAGMLDVVGFDTATPSVIADFSRD